MRSCTVCIVLLAVVGSAISASRHRRQMPAMGMMGPPSGFAAPSQGAKGPGDIQDLMMGDVKNQAAMGVPIDASKIQTMQGGGADLGETGMGIANPSKEKISGLQTPPADIVGDAGAPPA